MVEQDHCFLDVLNKIEFDNCLAIFIIFTNSKFTNLSDVFQFQYYIEEKFLWAFGNYVNVVFR